MYLPGRKLHWSVMAFLFSFLFILLLVGWMYLIPAAGAMEHADATQRVWLRDTSRLLLAAILVTLGGILMICFRVGQYFLPRPSNRPTQTRYVDAWEEAGRRLEVPPEDDDDPPASV
jgi:hypothetical protein